MIKVRTLFFTSLVLVASLYTIRAEASGCDEVTMVRSKLDAYIVLDYVRRYVDGDRQRYDTAEKAMKNMADAMKLADLCGADIEDLKAQMPALRKKVSLASAQEAVSNLRDYAAGKTIGTAQWFIAFAFDALIDAKSSGADTSSLDKDFSRLCATARVTEAKQLLTELEAPDRNAPYYLTQEVAMKAVLEAIDSAKRSGADVSALMQRASQLKGYQAAVRSTSSHRTN